MRREKIRKERLTRKTHDDSTLVTEPLEDLSRNGGEAEVTDTKVGDLKTGRLELGDVKDLLEVGVQDLF
jgi:hypothetical protein